MFYMVDTTQLIYYLNKLVLDFFNSVKFFGHDSVLSSSAKSQCKEDFKGQSHSEKNTMKSYIFEKFMKNGALFVFTATSESLSLLRKSRLELAIFEEI